MITLHQAVFLCFIFGFLAVAFILAIAVAVTVFRDIREGRL